MQLQCLMCHDKRQIIMGTHGIQPCPRCWHRTQLLLMEDVLEKTTPAEQARPGSPAGRETRSRINDDGWHEVYDLRRQEWRRVRSEVRENDVSNLGRRWWIGWGEMKPPRAICCCDSLFVCERCASCVDHCKCEPPGALVSVNGRAGHEAIRTAIRLRQEQEPRKQG